MSYKRKYNANGKIIVDRAYLENAQRKSAIIAGGIIGGIFLLFVPCLCVVAADDDTAETTVIQFAVFTFIALAVVIFKFRTIFISMIALRKGAFTIVKDNVARKYVKSSSDSAAYYIKGTAYGYLSLPPITEQEYRDVREGEVFWIVRAKTNRDPVVCGVFPSSNYCISEELAPFLQTKNGSVQAGASRSPAHTAGKISSGMISAASASRSRQTAAKVKCVSCGKKYNAAKHPDACPRCGAIRVN